MAQTTSTSLPTVGEVILAWRKIKQLSSTQLANKAGVRIAYLSEIEHNKTQYPREEFLEKLALALGLELADIYARRMPPDYQGVGQEQVEGNKKGAAASANFRTPLHIKRQKILMHRLAVAEKKLEAAGKLLNELYNELCEITELVADTQNEEEN
ncbi:MAG TPA: helix-turn-helix transcriptional regulator, partial [Thermodesulfobacteriota bacterium]|nr:helix-turn-helix transcriptional regulator [Thermodesulfobacteriota bacterium]